MSNLLQWGKDVKKALIDKGMTVKQVASEAGYCVTTVSSLINGRYAKANYAEIAGKINNVLGTTGLPPRPTVPSEEWCKEVRKALVDRNMRMNQLAENVGFSRDRVSLVVNGHCLDEPVVKGINALLHISEPVVSSSDT